MAARPAAFRFGFPPGSGIIGGVNRTTLLRLALALTLVFVFAAAPALADSFVVKKADGEVFHVLDGQPPQPVAAGAAVSGGRLVVMEDAAAELVFPNQKSFAVPAGTVVYLDPAATDLQNACAGSMAIRDRTVLLVAPAEKEKLAAGRKLDVLLGIDPAAAVVRGVTRFALVASHDDDEGAPVEAVLKVFDVRPARGGRAPTSPYVLYRFTTDVPLARGAYELFVKTVEEPVGKKIGKSVSVGVQ